MVAWIVKIFMKFGFINHRNQKEGMSNTPSPLLKSSENYSWISSTVTMPNMPWRDSAWVRI